MRELRNYVEKAAILSDGVVIDQGLRSCSSVETTLEDHQLISGKSFYFNCQPTTWLSFRDRVNREYISFVLSSCGGNVSEAARLLKLERSYLHRLIKKLGVQKEVIIG